MQNIINRPTAGRVGDCADRELVLVQEGRSHVLGIVLQKNASSTDIDVAVLNEPGEPHPFLRYLQPRDRCLRFGTEYALEIEYASIVSGSPFPDELPSGTWAVSEAGWHLCLARSAVDDRGRFSRVWWMDNGTYTRPDQAVYFTDWSIWLSKDDMARPGAKPFFTHKAPKLVEA